MAALPEYDKSHYGRQRNRAIQYLGGICVRCDSKKELQFDHIDASTKSFDVAKNLNRRWGILVVELDKCQILCSPCHRKKTIECGEVGGGWNRGLLSEHGSAARYTSGCRCDPCRAAAATAKGRPAPTKPYRQHGLNIHGTATMYQYHKCRCVECKEGQRVRALSSRARKKLTSP